MPLTTPEYACLGDFSVLYSGGLDSTAVAILIGQQTRGRVHLLTYKHRYGTLFNEWSRRHTADLVRVLGPRVHHDLVDLTDTWNAIGAKQILGETLRFGHWVCCLGCQESMAALTIVHNLERRIANAFICSSVGGEYAVMSMPVTREMNAAFYARYGIRYNAPLLDLGIGKPEERALLRRHGIDPGWGARRSHQGYQPICVLGFQHALDIALDLHTTYPPERVAEWLEQKHVVMDRLIRAALRERGHDPEVCIAETRAIYAEEERRMAKVRPADAAATP